MNKRYEIFQMRIGSVVIAESGGKITDVFSLPELPLAFDAIHEETATIKEAARQLQEYFGGKRTVFELNLAPEGTPFQRRVWKALSAIPYAHVRSYKDIAVAIGNAKAVRAVGMANHRNPISFIIPCHRVIGANGSLVGYGGGLELKQWLLDLERQVEANR